MSKALGDQAELIRLAQTFVKEADAAVAFESSRKVLAPERDRK